MSGCYEQKIALPWLEPQLDSECWLANPSPHDAVISVIHFHVPTIDMLLGAPGRSRFWLRFSGVVVCYIDSIHRSNVVDGILISPFETVPPGEIRESDPRLSGQDPDWRQGVTARTRWVIIDAILGGRGIIVCDAVAFRDEPRQSIHVEVGPADCQTL